MQTVPTFARLDELLHSRSKAKCSASCRRGATPCSIPVASIYVAILIPREILLYELWSARVPEAVTHLRRSRSTKNWRACRQGSHRQYEMKLFLARTDNKVRSCHTPSSQPQHEELARLPPGHHAPQHAHRQHAGRRVVHGRKRHRHLL